MKKLILSVAILAGMTFVACSDEDEVPTPSYIGCAICEIPETGPSEIEEQPYEVCFDADGYAYVDNAMTPLQGAEYFALFCANEVEIPTGPGEEPGGSEEPGEPTEECVTCAAYEVMGMEMPAVDVCKGTNGNAFVMGMDQSIYYDEYIELQEMFTSCD